MCARPPVSATSVARSLRDILRGTEQDARVEVALESLVRHPAARLRKRDTPVDRQHVRARLAHRLEQVRRSR